MAALPIEWVLIIFYGPSAHRATYGRLGNTKYTKDYIQRVERLIGTPVLIASVGPGREQTLIREDLF